MKRNGRERRVAGREGKDRSPLVGLVIKASRAGTPNVFIVTECVVLFTGK
jgi:hypothetical protein